MHRSEHYNAQTVVRVASNGTRASGDERVLRLVCHTPKKDDHRRATRPDPLPACIGTTCARELPIGGSSSTVAVATRQAGNDTFAIEFHATERGGLGPSLSLEGGSASPTPYGHFACTRAPFPAEPVPRVPQRPPDEMPMRGRQPGHHTTPALTRERARRPPTPALLPWTRKRRAHAAR